MPVSQAVRPELIQLTLPWPALAAGHIAPPVRLPSQATWLDHPPGMYWQHIVYTCHSEAPYSPTQYNNTSSGMHWRQLTPPHNRHSLAGPMADLSRPPLRHTLAAGHFPRLECALD